MHDGAAAITRCTILSGTIDDPVFAEQSARRARSSGVELNWIVAMRCPRPQREGSVIELQCRRVQGTRDLLAGEKPPPAIDFLDCWVDSVDVREHRTDMLPRVREAPCTEQLHRTSTKSLRHHVPFALPVEHERI